jgi:flagellar protein FliO/FliZ
MLLLCLTLLAAEPEAAPPPAPAVDAPAPAAEAPAPAAVPKADVPLELRKGDLPTLDDPKLAGEEEKSLGWQLVQMLLVLGAVIMLAYVSLNWGMRKLLGIRTPGSGGSLVSVIERVPLDQRRAVFVVKAANEYLLVGGAEQQLSLISKLDAAEVEKIQAQKRTAAPALTLSPFLQKLLGKGSKP